MLFYKGQSGKWHLSTDQSVSGWGMSKYKCPEVGQGWHVSGESSVQRVGRGDVHTQLYRLCCYKSGVV